MLMLMMVSTFSTTLKAEKKMALVMASLRTSTMSVVKLTMTIRRKTDQDLLVTIASIRHEQTQRRQEATGTAMLKSELQLSTKQT